ncbi:hypothetical protein [Limnofasciculus baicalensis]|nr:hypothetical protein [Limnofasciculus baicalensis]
MEPAITNFPWVAAQWYLSDEVADGQRMNGIYQMRWLMGSG